METAEREVYTIGHSTLTFEDLVSLLRAFRITCLADVRTIPRSRHTPQFNREALEMDLPAAGIQYVHLPQLGGLRKGSDKGSPNAGWRNPGFRGFADYMQTEQFARGLDELWVLTGQIRTALMCAEALYWRCHRSLIADAFLVRGGRVHHILSNRKIEDHCLTPFAVVANGRITYPPPSPSQSSLLP
jgi:uncharacterized protein (DUF488 family)